MKKVILAAAGALLATASFAQVSVDPEVGMNFSNLRTKLGDADATTNDARVGLKAGVGFNINLNKGFYLKPGVYYTQMGDTKEVLNVESTNTLHYLQIPVNLGYQYQFNGGKAGAVFAEAGPYIGYALGGQTKIESSLGEVKTDYNFGTEVNETNPLDWGFNFGLGYETPWNVYIKGQYGLGLGNLSNVDDVKVNNRAWGVSVGYKINLN